MPEPPRKNESQRSFIGRCISFMTENKEGNNPAQRAAVCYIMWRSRNKKTKKEEIMNNNENIISDEEQRKFIQAGKRKVTSARSYPELDDLPEGFVKPKNYVEILEDEVRHGVPDRMGNFIGY